MMTNYFLKVMYRSSSCGTDQQNFNNFNKTIQQKTCISPKLKSHSYKSVRIVLHFLLFFFFRNHIFWFFFSLFFFQFFFQIFSTVTGSAYIFFQSLIFFFFSLSGQLLIRSFTLLFPFCIRTHDF